MIVVKKQCRLSAPFITESGFILNNPEVAYEEYGNAQGPVVLVCHGGLSDMHAAGRYSTADPAAGWWDALIGPEKAIDTDKYRVISANALGSMFGTTGPLSINPATGKSYGAGFPEISFIDMVRYQKAFLAELGVEKLALMAGPSMGSMHSLQMAALYPEFVGAVVSVATAGRMTPYGMGIHHFIMYCLKEDPEYQEGRYEPGQAKLGLKIASAAGRLLYINYNGLAKSTQVPEGDGAQQQKSQISANYLTDNLEQYIANRDPNSYIRVVSAINTFDLGRDTPTYAEGVQRIKCPVLLINIRTDSEFPPCYAEEVGNILNAACPGQAEVHTIHSDWGHMGCVWEGAQLAPLVAAFLQKRVKG